MERSRFARPFSESKRTGAMECGKENRDDADSMYGNRTMYFIFSI